jgi:hypothetical protein
MRTRIARLFALLLLSLLLVTPATSAAEAVTDSGDSVALSPMMQEIQEALNKKETSLQSLQEELKTTGTESEALAIVRAIGQQKQDTEIEILSIQEGYARRAGELETAEKIAAVIERILNPPPAPGDEQAKQESEARKRGDQGHE